MVWLVVKDITAEEKKSIYIAFEKADYTWIGASIIIGILSHVVRAVRWKMLLQPLGYNPKGSNMFFSVMVGYLANLALPRLGEASRCGVLTKYEKIPFNESFGTVVAERAVDVICLVVITAITLLLKAQILYSFASEKLINPALQKIDRFTSNPIALVVFLLITVALIFVVYKFLFAKKSTDASKATLVDKFRGMIKGFMQGLVAIKKIKHPVLFGFYSILIWGLYYGALHICFLSFEETKHLGILEALCVLIFGSLGIMFVPGGAGAYQKLVIETLAIFSVPFVIAFAFAWIAWAAQVALVLVIGAFSLIALPLFNKGK